MITALGITVFSLGVGTLGYHCFEKLPWLDALLGAAMILTGMGPSHPIQTTGGKLFATVCALFSGIVFFAVAGHLVVPILHRFLHAFDLDCESEETPRYRRSPEK